MIEQFLQIANKEGEDVPFKLNAAQKTIDENLSGRDLIPKARQEGVSSYFLARYTVACLLRRNTKAVVISHEAESTQRMLRKVRYYVDHFRGPKPTVENMSANMITFPKMDSMFYIGTAGSKKFGRGDTISHLHCSEYAYWPDAKSLMAGLLQAVPKTGEVAVESTGNGLNDYYRRCTRAAKGESAWRAHFLPWHTFPEYTLDVDDEVARKALGRPRSDLDEDSLSEQLTAGQLLWRRTKLEEMDYDIRLFNQEYPMTLADCFQASGESIFYRVLFKSTSDWRAYDKKTHYLRNHPVQQYTYVVGADVGAGVEKDSSCIEVICLDTMEQVFEYTNNKIAPDVFAEKIFDIATKYNTAFIVPEQNNHGLVTVKCLQELMKEFNYPRNRLYQEEAISSTNELLRSGFRTTSRTKPLMIGNLRKLLATELTIHSDILQSELSTFVEHENGTLGAAKGCYDDTVMALACAAMGLPRAGLFAGAPRPKYRTVPDPFLLDTILDELHGREVQFPIAPQHGGSWR